LKLRAMILDKTFSYIENDATVDKWLFWEIIRKSDKSLVFFYPKNDTPGCTIENKDFSCLQKDYALKWIQLIWVSKDSIESHRDFREKYNLNLLQISDPELVLHKHFSAYWEKNNYGKVVLWVIRSTFLIDSKWNILKSWKNVRAKWHAEKVLREI